MIVYMLILHLEDTASLIAIAKRSNGKVDLTLSRFTLRTSYLFPRRSSRYVMWIPRSCSRFTLGVISDLRGSELVMACRIVSLITVVELEVWLDRLWTILDHSEST
jgi:hypothetical protein